MALKLNTKRILANSFCELLEEKSIDDISVQNIVDYCGASRTTFYNHFSDKYELMLWIYEQDMKNLVPEKEVCTWNETATHMLEYFQEKRSFYLNISQYVGQNSIQEGIANRMAANTEESLKKKLYVRKLPSEMKYAIEVYSRNVTNSIFQWLKNPATYSKEEVLRSISACMPVILAEYFYESKYDKRKVV